MIPVVATYHISETEAAREFPGLMDRVRAGFEVVIESGDQPVAVLLSSAPPSRTIEESIELLPKDSRAVMDEDFARDVEAAIDAHRDPLNPPAWK